MKKSILTILAAVMTAILFCGNMKADEANMTPEQAKIEASLFVDADALAGSSDAKLSEALIADSDNDTDAKCWFWCYPRYCYYPAYYYYSWYCPWYYVRFRLVTYSIPVVTHRVVVQPAVATTTVTTEAAATEEVVETAEVAENTVIAKSTGKTAKGVVIDQKVTPNSPLYKLGLRSGDIITKIDGKPVTSMIDAKRIQKNSKVSFVRGANIKVAGKNILTKKAGNAKTGEEIAVDADTMAQAQNETISLYEYYDSLDEE